MTATPIQLIAAALFAVAILHTFSTKLFEHLAHTRPAHAGLWHLLGEVEEEIGFRLKSFLRGRGLGRSFGSSQGFEFPSGDTVEPDVSFVSAARWGTAPRPRKFLRVVPELVFEILSPSTARIDLGPKRRVYARNGVLEYVLVDSERRVLTVFRGEERRSVGEELGADATFSSRVLPGFGFRVGELFEEL